MSSNSVTHTELNKRLHKMILVYNAVMDGWTVRKTSSNQLKFTKRNKQNLQNEESDYPSSKQSYSFRPEDLDLQKFISDNVSLEELFSNN